MSFVLDASVALLWLAPATNPEGARYAEQALKALKSMSATVPSIFTLEIANVDARLESRENTTEADSHRYLTLLGRLRIHVDQATAVQALGDTLNLARRYKLSAYDASYLELALRAGLPLATLDQRLATAAMAAGVRLFEAN